MISIAARRLIDAVITHTDEDYVIALYDEAVLQMLAWEAMTFTFTPDATVGTRPVRIEHDVVWLFSEAARRRTMSRWMPFSLPLTLETQVQVSPRGMGNGRGDALDVYHWRVLSQVMGVTSVRAIAAAIDVDPAFALCAVTELASMNLLEVVVSEPRFVPIQSPAQQHPLLNEQPYELEQAVGAAPRPVMDKAPGRSRHSERGLIEAVINRIRKL